MERTKLNKDYLIPSYYDVSENIFASIVVVPEGDDLWTAMMTFVMYKDGKMLHTCLESSRAFTTKGMDDQIKSFIKRPKVIEELILCNLNPEKTPF